MSVCLVLTISVHGGAVLVMLSIECALVCVVNPRFFGFSIMQFLKQFSEIILKSAMQQKIAITETELEEN